MTAARKILIWCFIIGEIAILPSRKRFDIPIFVYVEILTECCLLLSLYILLSESLMRGRLYPKKFILLSALFIIFVYFQKIILRISWNYLILGIRSYLKFPLFFWVLINTFRSAIDYRELLKFFRAIMIISIPLSLLQFYVLRWHYDWCGGILPSGEFALFGTFMFLLEASLFVITKRKRHLFIMLGILLIFLTAETKLPFFVLPILILIPMRSLGFRKSFTAILISLIFLVIGIFVSKTVVSKSKLKEYIFSPQKVLRYISVDRKTGKQEILDNEKYRLLAQSNPFRGYRLNRLIGLIYVWREVQDNMLNILVGKGIGISTPTKAKLDNNVYVDLGINDVQINKGILEIGIIGMLICISLILSQTSFVCKNYSRFSHPLDLAVVLILLPVVFCYLAAIFYNQVFMIRGPSIFLWSVIAYGNKLQESL